MVEDANRIVVYDHPLSKVSSRDSLLTHFILLHLLASPSIPSVTPSALRKHALSLANALHARWHGVAANATDKPVAPLISDKGKGKLAAEEEWLGLQYDEDAVSPRAEMRKTQEAGLAAREGGADGWWRLWDVSAECHEIGGMECYDGYHMAMIEQYVPVLRSPFQPGGCADRLCSVISLSLFPSLKRTSDILSSSSRSSFSYSGDQAAPQPSFLRKLAGYIGSEIGELLSWDLRVNTVVHFNEVGKPW